MCSGNDRITRRTAVVMSEVLAALLRVPHNLASESGASRELLVHDAVGAFLHVPRLCPNMLLPVLRCTLPVCSLIIFWPSLSIRTAAFASRSIDFKKLLMFRVCI